MVNAALRAPVVAAPEEFRRFERKFPVEPARADLLAAWLGHACLQAGAYPVGRVTSCYFDTPDWDSYFASIDGDHEKRKVRLRWYDALPATGPVTAFLETKEKAGFATWKRRAPVTLDASRLRAGQFERALPRALLDSTLVRLGDFEGGHLRPAVVISYLRLRFVEPASGIQLALDTHQEAWPAGSVCTGPVASLGPPVLEIKGPSLALPPRLSALRRWVTVWSSHSKYATAVESLARVLDPRRL